MDAVAVGLCQLIGWGILIGLAYAIIKEDGDGGLSAGTNVLWNGDPRIEKALGDSVESLKDRMEAARPKSAIILPN